MMRTGNKPDDPRCTRLHSAQLQVVTEICHPDKRRRDMDNAQVTGAAASSPRPVD